MIPIDRVLPVGAAPDVVADEPELAELADPTELAEPTELELLLLAVFDDELQAPAAATSSATAATDSAPLIFNPRMLQPPWR
jgi:hypothetical protein